MLLVPSETDAWPAGGTDYYIAGNEDANWPQTLDSNVIGYLWNGNCSNPSPTAVVSNVRNFNMAGCIWGGSATLIESYRTAQGQHTDNLTIADGAVTRVLQRIIPNSPAVPYTLAPNLGVVAPSYFIGRNW